MFLIDRISCFPHFVGVKEKVDYKEKWRKWDGFKSPGVYIRKGKIIKTRGCVPFTIFQLWWAWAGQRIISFLDSLVVVAAQILIVSLKSLATRLLLYIDFLLYSQLFFCFSPFFVCFIDSSSKQQQTSWAFVSYSSSSVFLPRLTLSWLACAQRVCGAFRDGRTGAATPQCPDVRVSPRDETRQEHGK